MDERRLVQPVVTPRDRLVYLLVSRIAVLGGVAKSRPESALIEKLRSGLDDRTVRAEIDYLVKLMPRFKEVLAVATGVPLTDDRVQFWVRAAYEQVMPFFSGIGNIDLRYLAPHAVHEASSRLRAFVGVEHVAPALTPEALALIDETHDCSVSTAGRPRDFDLDLLSAAHTAPPR